MAVRLHRPSADGLAPIRERPARGCAKRYSLQRSRQHGSAIYTKVQAKLDQMARDAGRRPAEVIEDAVVGLYDELAYTREMLDRRYDEMESGKAPGIDGEEAYRRLMDKTQERRQRRRHERLYSSIQKHSTILTKFGRTLPRTTPTRPTGW